MILRKNKLYDLEKGLGVGFKGAEERILEKILDTKQ